MRKTQKSKLYDFFNCLTTRLIWENRIHVVDDGFFLLRVVYHDKENFCKILNRYVLYAKNSVIIFDGYSCTEITSTKNNERQRRFLKNAATEIIFNR